ncbi:WYL domain-containing protein [Cohnella sp. LGH]|uniref:helix-turn-helix transcriptional regulator n=1 Tax=Cohnella sp. LGH TaxID=1619153 RepID=UPI001ADA0E30|nr:WYL domain-containing protein [Cohnella sp. LGH]QTH42428.1 WYL domain-containing protein [Cohnella sp. LGH]
MRADRLLSLLSLLQARGRMTSKQLADELEISERTVHRDMEALAAAGIPVYAERGAAGGWQLSEGYRNRITGMTIGEIRSLLLLHSSSVVADLGLNEPSGTALRKLLSALPEPVRRDAEYVRERIHIDGAGWRSAPSRSAHLQTVQEAVWEQRKLRICYRGREADESTERTVLPLGLVAKTSVWYMVAMEDSAEEDPFRTFRLSRLHDADMLEETFVRPEDFDLATHWERSMERFKSNLPRYPAKVRVALARWEAFAGERYVKTVSCEEVQESEAIEAVVEFNTLESARDIVMKYGRDAEALAPEELRAAVRAECAAAAALYAE